MDGDKTPTENGNNKPNFEGNSNNVRNLINNFNLLAQSSNKPKASGGYSLLYGSNRTLLTPPKNTKNAFEIKTDTITKKCISSTSVNEDSDIDLYENGEVVEFSGLEKEKNSQAALRRPPRQLPDSGSTDTSDSEIYENINDRSLDVKSTDFKINHVIEEIITTEKIYIKGLRKVVYDYVPYVYNHSHLDLLPKLVKLFGNINEIYEQSQRFLLLLEQNRYSSDSIAHVFSESASIFEPYIQYARNKPTADKLLTEFDVVVKQRQNELNDKLGLSSYLLTPIQRLAKYKTMLEKMQKEVTKSGTSQDSVNSAITLMKTVLKKCDDVLATDSIKNCKIDLALQGSYIMRSNFNILQPKKFTSMVFLFDNAVVFTQQDSKIKEEFICVDSIEMHDLGLVKSEEKPCIFQLSNFNGTLRKEVSYILEAQTARIKNEWTLAIEEKLWRQLKNLREVQRNLSIVDSTRLADGLFHSLSIRRSRSMRNKTLEHSSTFYDQFNANEC